MVYRFSWIAGIAALGLAFWELSTLLRDSQTGTPWQVAIAVATLLGAGITWTAIAYRAPAWAVLVTNLVAFILLTGLIVAPETLLVVIPTADTWSILVEELGRALEVIRHSVEPVRPLPGLVVLISLLFWTLGFLLTAGLLNDRPFVAVLTPLIVAVQFAIIDRTPKGFVHLALFILVVAFSLIAIRADERDRGTGRLQRVNADRPPSRRPTPAIGLLITGTVVAGLLAVTLLGDRIPSDGLVPWRAAAGYSDEYGTGSTSFDPFTDIRANMIDLPDSPVFTAEIEGTDPSNVRFRTVTLDVYRNGRWATDRIHALPLDENPWIEASQQYRGQTIPIVANITIQNLSQRWMPAPVMPTAAIAASEDDTKSMRVRLLDGSLYLPGDVTYEDMEYSIRAEAPKFDSRSFSSLARTATGELSPLFQAAVDAGEIIPDLDIPGELVELDNLEFWTDVPDDLGSGVLAEARRQTPGLETNFEKALALEDYFRFTGGFEYDQQVPDEYTTGDVSDWLTDPDNPYARHGYCEQFATAMALMGRSIGVPSRVVMGFTPGESLNDKLVQVKGTNAHAWVEMWIPSYGWMAFDPTPRSGYSAATADESLSDLLEFSPMAFADEIPPATILDLAGGDEILDDGRFTSGSTRPPTFVPTGAGSDGEGFTLALPEWASWMFAVIGVALLVAVSIPASKWIRRRRRLRRLASGDIAAAWEDITDRLADLGEPVDAAATPLEAAESVDEAFLPLATTYGQALYGEYETTTAVIDRATDAHTQAVQHVTTRFSRTERTLAAFRPTSALVKWSEIRFRRNGNGNGSS